jgi:hypothetical protein
MDRSEATRRMAREVVRRYVSRVDNVGWKDMAEIAVYLPDVREEDGPDACEVADEALRLIATARIEVAWDEGE